jgi:hypothetical protein
VAALLLGGVAPSDVVLAGGYELGFVFLPGWLVLRSISPSTRSPAWQLALGWPVGIALEIFAFILTAALGVREVFDFFPLIAGVPAAFVFWARRRNTGDPVLFSGTPVFPTSGPRWALAGLALFALACLSITHYAGTPLPDDLPSLPPGIGIAYHPDNTFYIALAADALHHWPPGDAGVAGLPFNYHYFANLHMAAISQVTGINLATIEFRLFIVPLLLLLVVQMGIAARLITGRIWAGPLAVFLLLAVRAIDISIFDPAPFTGGDLYVLAWNPSTMLGLNFLVPIVTLLCCLLDLRVSERAPPGLSARRPELVAVLAILFAGAGGAKSVVLPLILAGLVLWVVWERLRGEAVDRLALWLIGLTGFVFLLYTALLYSKGEAGLHPSLLGGIEQLPVITTLHAEIGGSLPADAVFWALALPLAVVMYFAAPVLGLAWLRDRTSGSFQPAERLGICLFLAGLPAFFLLRHDFQNQDYFATYGIVAATPFAAGGLLNFFNAPERRAALTRGRLVAFGIAWTASVVGLAFLGDRVSSGGHLLRADALLYTTLLLGVAALALAAWLARGRGRAILSGFAVLAVLLTAAVDVPLDLVPTFRKVLNDEPLYSAEPDGLHPGELQAMEWIRDNLEDEAILAVGNLRSIERRSLGPAARDWPAFTERRTFLEGWAYSQQAYKLQHGSEVFLGRKLLFRHRRRLEQLVFYRGDGSALRQMMDRYGVGYLVVDRYDGPVDPAVPGFGRVVYSNPDVTVIELPSR